MQHPAKLSDAPGLHGPSFPTGPYDPVPDTIQRKCNQAAAGFENVAALYADHDKIPDPGKKEGDSPNLTVPATLAQRHECNAARGHALAAAIEAEIDVRRSLDAPAGEHVAYLETVVGDCNRVLTSLREHYQQQIDERDFPDAVPISVEVCGPVRKERERLASIKTHSDSAREWRHANSVTVERLEALLNETRKRTTGAERELRRLAV